jgi:TolB protein
MTVAFVFLTIPSEAVGGGSRNEILFENNGIWSMRADGTHRERVTSRRGVDADAAWSPDGRRLVFARYRVETRNWDLYAVAGKEVPRRLTKTRASERDPAWSPDGKQIAFTRNGDGVYLMRADGTGVHRISPTGVTEGSPSWAPSGKRLALVSDRFERGDQDVYIVGVDGKNASRLTHISGGSILEIDWGPSRWIAFDVYPPPGRCPRAYVVRPNGSQNHKVARCYETRPVWSPSGNKLLVWNKSNTERAGIWRTRADGTGRVHLTTDGVATDWIRR